MRQGVPVFVALPVVWVALELARAYVISGFPWFFLGHTQWQQTRLIQIADLTSDYGVSFFVAMVNGAIVDVLTPWLLSRAGGQRRIAPRQLAATLAVVLAAGGLFGYGSWRINQFPQATHEGPVIGLVQLAFPISLSKATSPDDVLTAHIGRSMELQPSRCNLVIWPETMLPSGINPEVLQADLPGMKGAELRCLGEHLRFRNVWDLEYSDNRVRSAIEREISGVDSHGNTLPDGPPLMAQARRVAEVSRRLGCPLLAGGAAIRLNDRPLDDHDLWVTQNCAMWFDRGPIATDLYAKSHLVPFGEYVPFRDSWPWLHEFLRSFVPPVMEQIEPGRRLNHFTLCPPHKAACRIASPICYEGAFARVCRAMVYQGGASRSICWPTCPTTAGSCPTGGARPSRSSTSASTSSAAIENRVPVVRAVNTGISASIDSCGRLTASIPVMSEGTLALDGLRDDVSSSEPHYAPGHGPVVLVDERVSGYDLVGDLFAGIVAAAGLCLAAWARWKSRKTPGRGQ